jgi:hypothetical protein
VGYSDRRRQDDHQRGIVDERFNMRGGGARDPKAGRKSEHDLAVIIRSLAASLLGRWPRTQAMLLRFADMWEDLSSVQEAAAVYE